RSGDSSYSERISLIGTSPRWTAALPERLFHLCRWFSSVMDQPAAIWWIAGFRQLNPTFVWHLRREYGRRDAEFPQAAVWFWRLYLEFDANDQSDDLSLDWYEFKEQVAADGWCNATLRSFEKLVEPRVAFGRYHWAGPCPPSAGWDELDCRQ